MPELAPESLPHAQPAFAGFWIRCGAAAIDGIVVFALVFAGAAAGAGVGAVAGHVQEGAVVGYCLLFLGALAYRPCFESSGWQATPGKRAAGVIVTDTGGRRISLGRAFGRMFAKLLNGLTLGVGWLMVGLTPQKRGLHDVVAGTVVVQTPVAAQRRWVIGVGLCVLVLPFFGGIVAAIAIPGLLRARITGNETSAIATLRAIAAAQQAHKNVCGGFAPDLPSLSTPQSVLESDLTSAAGPTSAGYRFNVATSSDAVGVTGGPKGCERTVSAYQATAVPVAPGASGVRYFAVGNDGRVIWDMDGTFGDPKPLQ